jgi:hypothetical protein
MAEETPQRLDGARVLKYAAVTPDVEPTGFTRHTVDGEPFRRASALAVAVYDDDPTSGYYLFYLGDHGGVVTDTRLRRGRA